MFNGIKSILFGYSTEEQTETNSNLDNTADRSATLEQISRESSFSHDTSALLEQTLNAATTKLTEQLLPRCPSIEQLQSSSHQLLPTLNEQHEEDELKRRKLNEVIEANHSENNAEDADDDADDDDDDGFEADSWELLDLVEKQPEPSLTGELRDNSSKTSGILKSSKTSTSSSNSQNNNELVVGIQKRQNKPKVSFETPDLVKETKEKIERITPKEKDVKLGNQKQEKEKEKEKEKKKVYLKKSKKFGGNIDDKSVDLFCCQLFPEIATDENIEKVVELKEEVEVNQLESSCKVLKPQPVLNYAAALSMKLNKKKGASEKLSTDGSSEHLKPDVKISSSSTNVKGSLQASGAVKRNRPVSFSSSSCENDDDDLEITWNDVIEPEPGTDTDGKCKKWQIDDDGNDSIVSSGFSDCDYGYEGLNDIIMRPKKASGKKRRGLSGSHRASIKKRDPINGLEVVVAAAKNKTLGANSSSSATPERKNSTGSSGKETSKPLISVSSSKNNTKPKKKKLILSSTTSSYEFKKKRSLNDARQPTTTGITSAGFKLVGTPSSGTQIIESKSTICKPISASHLMPPPQSSLGGLQTGSNTNSGNDSSDIADMDESWYVTPPPCFTGSNRFMKSGKVAKFSKAKEADRENALIEHPSIYIASTSKQQPAALEKQQSDRDVVSKNKNKEPASTPLENNLLLTKQKPIVLRKVGKVANNSSSSESDNKRKVAYFSTTTNNKSLMAPKHQSSQNNKKNVIKAWENKFIVTDWSHDDEQEDVNEDFDNMFSEIDKCPSSKNQSFKAKKSSSSYNSKSKFKVQSIRKRKEEIELQSLGRSISPEISPGYESDDFSIPLAALMNDIEVSSSDMSLGEVVPSPNSLVLISNNSSLGDENLMPEKQQQQQQSEIFGEIIKSRSHEQLVGSAAEKKAPTQVRPIEPERKPGWQLRRKRSRRRPLSTSMSNSCNAAASGGVKLTSVKPLTSKQQQQQQMMSTNNSPADASRSASRSGCSNLSSSCSSPTLIDHMSSIVANLTSGFTATASSSLPFQSCSTIDVECMEKSNHAAISLSPPHSEQSNLDSVSRRRMSKSYLDRQNNCSKLGNINRRVDRRMKMRTTPNGYSINRKVHTNFH